MTNNNLYLKIREQSFIGDLQPDMIMPTEEIIKNEERSIDGTMNVDIIARKIKLKITWSLLDSQAMNDLIDIAKATRAFTVHYIAVGQTQLKDILAYPGEFSYTPYFIGDKIMWRDVSLELIEI